MGCVARVAELVDAHGSGPCAARCGGSSPFPGTTVTSQQQCKMPAHAGVFLGTSPQSRRTDLRVHRSGRDRRPREYIAAGGTAQAPGGRKRRPADSRRAGARQPTTSLAATPATPATASATYVLSCGPGHCDAAASERDRSAGQAIRTRANLSPSAPCVRRVEIRDRPRFRQGIGFRKRGLSLISCRAPKHARDDTPGDS